MRKPPTFEQKDGKRALILLDDTQATKALSQYHKQAIRLNRELQSLRLFGECKTEAATVHTPTMQLLIEARDQYLRSLEADNMKAADAFMGRIVALMSLVAKLRGDAAAQLGAALEKNQDRKLKASIASKGASQMTAADLFKLANEKDDDDE